jgi:hypothetical protein
MKCCNSKKKFMGIPLHNPNCKTQERIEYCACGNILYTDIERKNQMCRECI